MLLRRHNSRREFPKQEAKQPPVETPVVEETQTPPVDDVQVNPPVEESVVQTPAPKRNRRKNGDVK